MIRVVTRVMMREVKSVIRGVKREMMRFRMRVIVL